MHRKKYLLPLYELLHKKLLELLVNQCDETPVQVVNDNNPDEPNDVKSKVGHKNYMWVQRSGEFYTDRPIVLFEYERVRGHEYPEAFYKGYQGVLMTDGLQQYHMIEKNDRRSHQCELLGTYEKAIRRRNQGN